MGELNNLAKKQSKFLKIDIGESTVVKFLGYQIIPSQFDPEKQSVQYKLEWEGSVKFWTNGSGAVMRFFDEIPKDAKVRISRDKQLDPAGNVVEGKSSYQVIEVKDDAV